MISSTKPIGINYTQGVKETSRLELLGRKIDPIGVSFFGLESTLKYKVEVYKRGRGFFKGVGDTFGVSM